MRAWLLACVVAACWGAGPAGAADAGEIAFWKAVSENNDAASYQAYLDAFPDGTYAALARLRLARPGPAVAPVQAPAAVPAREAAWLRTGKATVRFVDGVVVDMDAQGLRDGSNWRLAVVPAGWPDGPPPDMAGFLQDSVGVGPQRMHVTVPSGPAGRDEVRLYWIPGSATTYVVAARVAVTVLPGVPGAALMRDLAREAAAVGPVRFEAAHRDRPMLVQAAFLRVHPQSEWDLAWFRGVAVSIARPSVVVGLGQVGAVPDGNGSLGEGVCLLDAAGAALDAIAGLRTGDAVLVRAVPSTWASAAAASPILLTQCALVR